MGCGSDKNGQDKKRLREKHRENRKAGGQTSGCMATLVWTREKEEKKATWKKGRWRWWFQVEGKKKAKKKVNGFDKRRREKGGSLGGRRS